MRRTLNAMQRPHCRSLCSVAAVASPAASLPSHVRSPTQRLAWGLLPQENHYSHNCRSAAAMHTPRRHQWGQEPIPNKGFSRVGHRIDDHHAMGYLDEGSLNQPEDFDGLDGDGGDGDGTPRMNAAADVAERAVEPEDLEPKIVEYSEEEAGKLDRLFKKKVLQKSFLSPKEQAQLERMLFLEFYKDLGQGADDPAMHYQASLELLWIEEWVEGLMDGSLKSPASGSNGGVAVPKNDDEARRLVKRSVLERVDLHKPLSYIIGTQPFYGCDIACRAPLLCPRPETEMWTHWLVKESLRFATAGDASTTPIKVLDMCSGTGCIGVAIAKHVSRAVITALDLLPDAVATSTENARSNRIPSARYAAHLSDMFEYFSEPVAAAAADAAAAAAGPQANAYPRMPASKEEKDRSLEEQQRYYSERLAAEAEDEENGKEGEAAPAQAAAADPNKVDRFRSVVNLATRPRPVIRAEHVGTFDVIVSNPPYVLPDQYVALPRNITHWESKMALVGDDYRETRQYLYFQELCECGVKLLKARKDRDPALVHHPNLVIEVGLQARMVASIMEHSGLFEDIEVHTDYANQERWITANTLH